MPLTCTASRWIGLLALIIASPAIGEDWRVWRGPNLDNHAPSTANAEPPERWSETDNVVWKSPIPGKGHATPIVVDGGVFVLTHESDQRTISLLRYNLADGKPTGKVVLHTNVIPPGYLHQKNTCASSTPSSDGRAIYTIAQVNESIVASAISLQGKILWQTPVSPYRPNGGGFGFGASPLLLKDALVVAVDLDNQAGGLFAIDLRNGRQRWRGPRPLSNSYSSPIAAKVGGVDQILMSGGYKIAGYNPANGQLLWSVDATSQTTCGTMVWNDSMVFASGSYPDPGTFGVRVNGRNATIAWSNKVKCYEQSMLLVDDYLYGLADNGVLYCWRAEDGNEMWKQRLEGPVSASPLLIGDRIYASNERGVTFVFRANPERFEAIAENQLGSSSFATPIYVDGRLILRHASDEGPTRQEYLYAIGNE